MSIDASIYSLIKQPEAFNPLAEMAQFEQLRGLQTQNKLAQLGFADRERGLADAAAQRDAVRGFGSDATANYNRLLQTGNIGAAQGYLKGEAERAKMGADAGKVQVDTTAKAFDTYRAMLGTVQTPEQAAQFLAASHADPAVGPILQRFGTLEQGLARIPRDPAGFAQWRAHTAIGIEKLADQAKVQNVNLGGAVQTQVFQPATGQLTVTGAAPVTQSPDNIATNERSAANNAASLGVTIRGQDLADERSRDSHAAAVSKPFEVTGTDGSPVLVQQDRAGNITPVAGYTPKGGTAKPLPGPVLKQLTEARDNAVTIDRLTAGFKAEFAGKGVLGVGAEAQLDISGRLGKDNDAVQWWKNYRKQAELVERHALFGASLTANEQAAWRSADISPGLDAKVIERNLATRAQLTRKVFDNTRQDLIDAGHSEKRVNAISDRNTGQASGGPRSIANDDDYQALPSGTVFIAPDGQRRRKP